MPPTAELEKLVNEINKKQGPGAVVRGSELAEINRRITTGSVQLDVILGGGWPVNSWHQIVGEFSSGKTAILFQTIAANQRMDPDYTVWWVASEHIDKPFARLNGVDMDRVIVHDTNVTQEAYEAILRIARTREVDCIVIDSLPALVPEEEEEGESGDWAVGLAPRLNNQFFRKQRAARRRSLVEDDRAITGFVINQYREKIGVMKGDPRTTPGGRQKDYEYIINLEVKRDDWIKQGDEPVGQVIQCWTKKNKSHRPYRRATIDYYFVETEEHPVGYNTLKEIIAVAVAYRVIRQSGSYFYYEDQRWLGWAGLRSAIAESPELGRKLTQQILAITRGELGPDDIVEPTDPAPKSKAAKPVAKAPKKVLKAAKAPKKSA